MPRVWIPNLWLRALACVASGWVCRVLFEGYRALGGSSLLACAALRAAAEGGTLGLVQLFPLRARGLAAEKVAMPAGLFSRCFCIASVPAFLDMPGGFVRLQGQDSQDAEWPAQTARRGPRA